MAPMNHHPALQTYLDAVASRNLAALMPLIGPEVTLVLPQGQLLTGPAEFETFHREWFADPDWKLQADLVRSRADAKTAVFVLHVTYLDKNQAGKLVSFSYFLSLSFVQAGGRWSLILDQSTLVQL